MFFSRPLGTILLTAGAMGASAAFVAGQMRGEVLAFPLLQGNISVFSRLEGEIATIDKLQGIIDGFPRLEGDLSGLSKLSGTVQTEH